MLKVGQKVMVKNDLVVDKFYGGGRFHAGMAKYKGMKGEVLGVKHYDKTKYGISVECEGYDWTAEMLEVLQD